MPSAFIYGEGEINLVNRITPQNILRENPRLIIHKPEILNDMIVFGDEDNKLHIFSAHDNFKNMFVDYKNQAKEKMRLFNKIRMEF